MYDQVALPTDRSFGGIFAIVFALLAGWLYWSERAGVIPALVVSGAILFIALLRSSLLHPFNVLWMKFARLLNKVTSPIVLGAMYYLVFVPTGLVMRLAGRDALRRRSDHTNRSYWIERQPPGPLPESLIDQF